MCLDNCPIEFAANNEAIRARITESGAAPPLKAMPAGMESAVAIAGAMNVMDWKRTPPNPTAPVRNPCRLLSSDLAISTIETSVQDAEPDVRGPTVSLFSVARDG